MLKTTIDISTAARKNPVKILALVLLHFVCITQSLAQESLSLEEAIKTGLEKNYDIQISRNNKEIARVQNNLGAAGMSPTVTANASINLSNLNSHQEFSTGSVQDRNGASSNNVAASLNAAWTVFDGLKMFAIRKRLSETEQLGDLQLKQQMSATTYSIILAYYDVVRVNELIKASRQNLSIYEERKKIAQLKLQVGSDSKVDFLLTQSDENQAKSTLLQLELQLMTSKALLNKILVRPVDVDFKPSDSIVMHYNPGYDELKKSVLDRNPDILISKQNELIAAQSIREARSANMPNIQLLGAYNFTRAQSQAGFVFLSRQAGLNYGAAATWLLFNGDRNRRLVQERQIRLLSQKYVTEQSKMSVDANVYINYQGFLTNKKILDLETQNLADSKEVLNVSLERYRLGKAALLETIETQKNLEDAQTRYINALYNLKKAETELLLSNNGLVK